MFDIILKLFIIIGLGYVAAKVNLVERESSKYFSRFVFYVAVPASILALFGGTDVLSQTSPALLALNTLPVLLLILFFYALNRAGVFGSGQTCMLILAAMMPSSLFVGFPVVEVLFGKEGMALATIIAPMHLVFTMAFGIPLIELLLGKSKRGIGQNMKKVAMHPIILAIAAGLALNLAYATLPDVLLSALETVGSSTTPIALFAMGLFMGGTRIEAGKLQNPLLLSIVRMTLYAALILLTAPLFGVGGLALKVSVLLSMMPVAILDFILALEYGLDAKAMAFAIIVTTLLLPVPIFIVTALL